MRKVVLSIATTLSFFASIASASAQMTANQFIGQPFVAGYTASFTAALINLNFFNFFSGLNPDGTSIKSQGFLNSFTTQAASFGTGRLGGTQSTTTPTTPIQNTLQLVLVMTGLENSLDPRYASTGVAFANPKNMPITSVSFQYSPLNGTTGLVTNDYTQAPYLAITDNNGMRTRLLPVTSGLLATNAAINTYNAAFNSSSTSSTTALTEGFMTSTFTQDQLAIQGNVTKLGLVYVRNGIVLINNFTINGTAVGLAVDNTNNYPF